MNKPLFLNVNHHSRISLVFWSPQSYYLSMIMIRNASSWWVSFQKKLLLSLKMKNKWVLWKLGIPHVNLLTWLIFIKFSTTDFKTSHFQTLHNSNNCILKSIYCQLYTSLTMTDSAQFSSSSRMEFKRNYLRLKVLKKTMHLIKWSQSMMLLGK